MSSLVLREAASIEYLKADFLIDHPGSGCASPGCTGSPSSLSPVRIAASSTTGRDLSRRAQLRAYRSYQARSQRREAPESPDPEPILERAQHNAAEPARDPSAPRAGRQRRGASGLGQSWSSELVRIRRRSSAFTGSARLVEGVELSSKWQRVEYYNKVNSGHLLRHFRRREQSSS